VAIRPTPRPYECSQCGQTHERCIAHNKSGGPCGRIPPDGADVCLNHGAGAPQVKEAAAQRVQLAIARRECDRLGIPIEIDPTEALLREVWETAGNVEFYRMLVQQLPTHPEDDELTFDEKGDPRYERGEPGIYGRTYHVSGVPTGEGKRHILVQMYDDERKHLVEVTGVAIRLGIEKRRVDLEENRAIEVFRAVTQALTAMGLGEKFDEFRGHFATALASGRSIPVGIGATS
jgi:hypothetical protein